jgi:hypothetical protein
MSSLQLLIDSVRNAGAVGAPARPDAAVPGAAPSGDFGDAVQAAFEAKYPRAVGRGDASPPATADEPLRFKPGANRDFGDAVAEAYDRLFPPKGDRS